MRTEVESLPLFTAVHGIGGIGKTSFAAHLPSPVFVCDIGEKGVDDLKRARQLPEETPVLPWVDSWSMLVDVTEELIDKAADTGWETVVFDSLTGIEQLCFTQHCEEAYDGDWSQSGFYSFYQGPKSAARSLWPDWLRLLGKLRASGVNVVLIGHSQVKNFANPEGPDYERWIPYLDKETWSITYREVESCLFMNYQVDVSKEGPKAKAKGGDKRFIHTEWTASYDAKNRWGIKPFIDMGTTGEEAAVNFLKEYQKAVG